VSTRKPPLPGPSDDLAPEGGLPDTGLALEEQHAEPLAGGLQKRVGESELPLASEDGPRVSGPRCAPARVRQGGGRRGGLKPRPSQSAWTTAQPRRGRTAAQ
jgi:hypothetical protein